MTTKGGRLSRGKWGRRSTAGAGGRHVIKVQGGSRGGWVAKPSAGDRIFIAIKKKYSLMINCSHQCDYDMNDFVANCELPPWLNRVFPP